MTHRERAFASASVLLAALAGGSLAVGGCDDGGYVGGALATVDVQSVALMPDTGEATDVEALLRLQLEAYEDDELALDAITLQLGTPPGSLEILSVDVDPDDWPVRLQAGEVATRDLRVRARATELPAAPAGPCSAQIAVEATVELLNVAGTTEAYGYADLTLPGGNERLGLARARVADLVSEVGDPSAVLVPMIDGRGAIWVLAQASYLPSAHLFSRTSAGSVVSSTLSSPVASAAPMVEGGVLTVLPRNGGATAAFYADALAPSWEIGMQSGAIFASTAVPVTSTLDGATAALPASAALEIEGLDTIEATNGTLLVRVGRSGDVSVETLPEVTGVQQLAASDDDLYLGTSQEVWALRDRRLRWSVPLAPQAMATAPGGDLVLVSGDVVTRLDAATGSPVWTQRVGLSWWPASIGVREDGSVLVGTLQGGVASFGPDGEPRFEGAVLCQGTVAFGGGSGHVVFASHFVGPEGWGDGPDRNVEGLTLSLGEVLP